MAFGRFRGLVFRCRGWGGAFSGGRAVDGAVISWGVRSYRFRCYWIVWENLEKDWL